MSINEFHKFQIIIYLLLLEIIYEKNKGNNWWIEKEKYKVWYLNICIYAMGEIKYKRKLLWGGFIWKIYLKREKKKEKKKENKESGEKEILKIEGSKEEQKRGKEKRGKRKGRRHGAAATSHRGCQPPEQWQQQDNNSRKQQ